MLQDIQDIALVQASPVFVPDAGDVMTPRVLSTLANVRRHDTDISTQACKIMIVDDEQFNVMVFRRYLRDAGYRNIIHTSDSTAALDLLVRERPDILLLDIVMPGMNGLEILAQMSSEATWGHLPVLVLTASRRTPSRRPR